MLMLSPHQWTSISTEVSIFSDAPFGNIEATSTQANCTLTNNKTLIVVVPVQSFIFSKVMMQEHFNSKYMESDSHPRAIFKGEIKEDVGFDRDGIYPVTVAGKLKIHGTVKNRVITGKIMVKGDKLLLASDFDVKTSDHKISIPQVLGNPVCETVKVSLKAELIKKSL